MGNGRHFVGVGIRVFSLFLFSSGCTRAASVWVQKGAGAGHRGGAPHLSSSAPCLPSLLAPLLLPLPPSGARMLLPASKALSRPAARMTPAAAAQAGTWLGDGKMGHPADTAGGGSNIAAAAAAQQPCPALSPLGRTWCGALGADELHLIHSGHSRGRHLSGGRQLSFPCGSTQLHSAQLCTAGSPGLGAAAAAGTAAALGGAGGGPCRDAAGAQHAQHRHVSNIDRQRGEDGSGGHAHGNSTRGLAQSLQQTQRQGLRAAGGAVRWAASVAGWLLHARC